MQKFKKKKLITTLNLEGCDNSIMRRIRNLYEIKFISNKKDLYSNKSFLNADVYISSANIKVDKKFLNRFTKIKLILSPSTGKDHLDISLINSKKIKLIEISKEKKLLNQFSATSELVFLLILSIERSFLNSINDFHKGLWSRSKYSGVQLKKKTLGIIGLGRLGKITSKIAHGFDMKVIHYDIKKIQYKYSVQKSLDHLLKFSDYISIHIPMIDKNINFLDFLKLKKMKKNAIVINTSRGKIINEKDLLTSLKLKIIKGACLDVIDGEWLSKKDLIKHPLYLYSKNNNNLIITPHIGGSTYESIWGARNFILKKLLQVNIK